MLQTNQEKLVIAVSAVEVPTFTPSTIPVFLHLDFGFMPIKEHK